MSDYYDLRENAIKTCVDRYRNDIKQLKHGVDEASLPLQLIKEKTLMLRTFQQELDVEKIHRARSVKAVNERCRSYF
jgi:hypothetical protein